MPAMKQTSMSANDGTINTEDNRDTNRTRWGTTEAQRYAAPRRGASITRSGGHYARRTRRWARDTTYIQEDPPDLSVAMVEEPPAHKVEETYVLAARMKKTCPRRGLSRLRERQSPRTNGTKKPAHKRARRGRRARPTESPCANGKESGRAGSPARLCTKCAAGCPGTRNGTRKNGMSAQAHARKCMSRGTAQQPHSGSGMGVGRRMYARMQAPLVGRAGRDEVHPYITSRNVDTPLAGATRYLLTSHIKTTVFILAFASTYTRPPFFIRHTRRHTDTLSAGGSCDALQKAINGRIGMHGGRGNVLRCTAEEALARRALAHGPWGAWSRCQGDQGLRGPKAPRTAGVSCIVSIEKDAG
ncbi:hypothetical protein C8R44DRAFT_725285 [Mycena epipterygia]|nr:hypothetical protein C8R44DRAFT_725285 [Mycena epipterygia]